MLKDNLVMLRNIHGFSQETIAEKIGISRQRPELLSRTLRNAVFLRRCTALRSTVS